MGSERLSGYSSMYSQTRRVWLNNTLSIFDDGVRAGISVGSVTDPTDVEDVVYDSDSWRSRIRVVMQLANEKGGLPIQYDDHGNQTDACELCEGRGYWEDVDGDRIACPGCGGG